VVLHELGHRSDALGWVGLVVGRFAVLRQLVHGGQLVGEIAFEDHLVERFGVKVRGGGGLGGLSFLHGLFGLGLSLFVRLADRLLLLGLLDVGMVAFVGVDMWLVVDLHFLKGEGLDVKFEVGVQVLHVLVEGALVEEGFGTSGNRAEKLVTIGLCNVDLHVLFEIG